MNSLPPSLEPSSFVQACKVSRAAGALLALCNEARATYACNQDEHIAQDANTLLWRKKGDWLGYAVVLLRLSDLCRSLGKLGPALAYCDRARTIFHQEPAPEHRFHEAAATYGLGLLHQLLGAETLALEKYDEAVELFAQAKRHWLVAGQQPQARRCEVMQSWICKMIGYVEDIRAHGETCGSQAAWTISPWPGDGDSANLPPAYSEIDKVIPACEWRIGDRIFCLESPDSKGNRVSLDPNAEYFILEVPPLLPVALDARPGDCVLVRRSTAIDPDSTAVALNDEGTEWGPFERDSQGQIRFVAQPTRVIGAVGEVVGILKQLDRRPRDG